MLIRWLMNAGAVGGKLLREKKSLLLFRLQNGNYSVFRLRLIKPRISKLSAFLFVFCGHWNKLLLFNKKIKSFKTVWWSIGYLF